MSRLPDAKDTLKPGEEPRDDEVEVVIEAAPEIEIDVVDDTPAADRNRPALPEGDAEPTEEEMEQYSEAVKRRISKMKHGMHDERRAKEAATRERDAAISTAQQLLNDKRALEQRYRVGENAFINQNKEKVDLAMAEAKRAYKSAYEVGDADAMADAQERISTVALEKQRAEDWSRQAVQRNEESARQIQAPVVQSQHTSQSPVAEPDPDAVAWAAKNKWFGTNKVMTGAAYGVHDELVEEGVTPDTETYYKKLNTRIREAFPTYDWGDAPKKKITSVVAPVLRTSKTATRVTLTQSQLAVARKLGLTPQAYAVEVAKLEA